MKVGLIGLGKMGSLIAQRLLAAQHSVIGYDPHARVDAPQYAQATSIGEVAHHTQIIWLMVPAQAVDEVIKELLPHMHPGTIVIDGGNSHFTDSIARAELLYKQGFHFLDCGTSGGIQAQHGLSLTIGGRKEIFEQAEAIFKSIAAPHGYGYVGSDGAGHYVKMVHNAIEYVMLEGYAEGFHLLKNGHYTHLDLAAISKVWSHGAVIRSWLLEQTHTILKKDQQLSHISGKVAETGMGQWAATEAQQRKVAMPALAAALTVRAASRTDGGNFGTKLIAKLRNAFGGHPLLS